MAKLTRDFFDRTLDGGPCSAGKISGAKLWRPLLAGRITETEAYIGRCDKACHAYITAARPRKRCLWPPATPISISSTGCTTA